MKFVPPIKGSRDATITSLWWIFITNRGTFSNRNAERRVLNVKNTDLQTQNKLICII